MSARVLILAMLVGASLALPQARAQAFADPTRPPAAGSVTQEGDLSAPAPVGKQLQSVLFSRGRKVAVIDGTMVPLGGAYGEARVVKITESEVVLKQGEETETLKLFPSVEKQPARRASARTGAAAPGPASQGGAK